MIKLDPRPTGAVQLVAFLIVLVFGTLASAQCRTHHVRSRHFVTPFVVGSYVDPGILQLQILQAYQQQAQAQAAAQSLRMTPDEFFQLGAKFRAYDSGQNPAALDAPKPKPKAAPVVNTLESKVSAFFRRSCVRCHQPGKASGGLDLTNMAAAESVACEIFALVNTGQMPPPNDAAAVKPTVADAQLLGSWYLDVRTRRNK